MSAKFSSDCVNALINRSFKFGWWPINYCGLWYILLSSSSPRHVVCCIGRHWLKMFLRCGDLGRKVTARPGLALGF